jgi:hypothetical protein
METSKSVGVFSRYPGQAANPEIVRAGAEPAG